MKARLNESHTLLASYLGYITQAIINNLPPLLFVIFGEQFSISPTRLGLLITVNFVTQITVDLLSARYIDKIGYRISIVGAHVFCVVGLCALGILPFLIEPFWGIAISMVLSAIGGGLIEVLISPIVESLPGDQKASAMSVLHSFYCWGHMAVVILSTVFFVSAGTSHWRLLPFFWALLPLINCILFALVPLRVLVAEGDKTPLGVLFRNKAFWLFIVLMVCGGASELATSQWSSYFAEKGLGISKTLGDLLGPCLFALTMGLSRLLYGKIGAKMNVRRFIVLSAALCVFSYLLTVFAPHPLLSLIGCGLCGFSVGIFWPGIYSVASVTYPAGGTAMFAMLAFAGDIGCAVGPGMVGAISDYAKGSFSALKSVIPVAAGADLKVGMLFSLLFPLGILISMAVLHKTTRNNKI